MMAVELPPQPRKLPQQERSRRMVTAIVDACKKILVEHGEQALSLPLLEAVSGVTKGSIYQYFPNMQAIVAALYERECRSAIKEGLAEVQVTAKSQTLEEFINSIVQKSVDSHKQLRSLHSSFYSRYSAHYHIGEKIDEYEDTLVLPRNILAPLLEKYVAEVFDGATLLDSTRTAFLIMESIKALFWAALRYEPDYIYSENFHRQLLAVALTIVKSAERTN